MVEILHGNVRIAFMNEINHLLHLASHCEIWSHFTRSLYFHSPLARENTNTVLPRLSGPRLSAPLLIRTLAYRIKTLKSVKGRRVCFDQYGSGYTPSCPSAKRRRKVLSVEDKANLSSYTLITKHFGIGKSTVET